MYLLMLGHRLRRWPNIESTLANVSCFASVTWPDAVLRVLVMMSDDPRYSR